MIYVNNLHDLDHDDEEYKLTNFLSLMLSLSLSLSVSLFLFLFLTTYCQMQIFNVLSSSKQKKEN